MNKKFIFLIFTLLLMSSAFGASILGNEVEHAPDSIATISFTSGIDVYAGFSLREVTNTIKRNDDISSVDFLLDEATKTFLTPAIYAYVQCYTTDLVAYSVTASELKKGDGTQPNPKLSWSDTQGFLEAGVKKTLVNEKSIPDCDTSSPRAYCKKFQFKIEQNQPGMTADSYYIEVTLEVGAVE